VTDVTGAPGPTREPGVRVAGVGLHPFGRHDGVSLTAMGVAAAAEALEGRRDVTAAFVGTAYGGVAAGHKVLGALALTGMPIVDVEAGCASGAAALALGATAIRSGEHDRVLVLGIEKMPKGMIRSSFFEPWQEAAGLSPAPAYFALRAQRLLRERALTKEHLAAVVVKNRAHGAHNPDAMFRSAVTAEEVLASRVVCEPLHLWMLCSPNEGAAAVVLERAGGASRAGGSNGGGPAGQGGRRDGAVHLRAACVRSHLPGSVLAESTPMAGIDDTGIVSPTQLAAADAWMASGLGPDDVDVVECQDTDAARELLAWEELGLCLPGGQAAVLAAGAASLGGRRPVNPSGGLLSKGEPLGASALGQVVELVRQLRGQAGARQVEGARAALAHTIGRGANASVVVLTR
jgi:acetyl-CoA acetyltransferase